MPKMSAEMLSEMMSSEGPIVKAVVLRAGGALEELQFDSTPAKNEAAQILGGSATFVGQFPSINVVVMTRREPAADAVVSQHIAALPPPLHALDEPVRGDMLLVRMDDDGEPCDFALAEFEAFLKEDHSEALADYVASEKATAEADAAAAAGYGEEDDAEDDEDDEDEEEEDDSEEEDEEDDDAGELTEEQQQLLSRVIQGFQSQYSRDPTEEEVMEIMGKLNALMELQGGDAEEEEEEEEEKEEE